MLLYTHNWSGCFFTDRRHTSHTKPDVHQRSDFKHNFRVELPSSLKIAVKLHRSVSTSHLMSVPTAGQNISTKHPLFLNANLNL